MTDYSKLSDEQIAKLVGDILKLEWANLDDNYNGLCYWKNGELFVFDPCNNPTEAWSIIDDNEIALLPSTDFGWVAISGLMLNGCSSYIDQRLDSCFQHSDTNPLRAAMIVFLQMQENNHD